MIFKLVMVTAMVVVVVFARREWCCSYYIRNFSVIIDLLPIYMKVQHHEKRASCGNHSHGDGDGDRDRV